MNLLAVNIRTKKLGVLIKDARLHAGKSIEQTAEAIGISASDYMAYEAGDRAPSLPEIELLSYYLEIPIDHFWGNTALSESANTENPFEVKQLLEIRQKVIGTLLRQAREETGLSLQEVADANGLAPETLERIESGEEVIPLPTLEQLCSYLNRPIKEFQDEHGPVATWMKEQRLSGEFHMLSPELQAFVTKPINHPYIELAQRLSEMSVEKLRSVGEGILEITL